MQVRASCGKRQQSVLIEARHIAELLQKHHHSRRQVAAAPGISERTLYRKLRRYALN